MNITAKLQLHPTYGFRGDDFFFFFNFFFFNCPGSQSNSGVWTLDKIHMFGRGLLKEQVCKTFVKISAVR